MDITDKIQKGLRFLASSQNADGSFNTYNFPTTDPNKKTKVSTTFITANILHSLSVLQDEPRAEPIIKKATKFLLKQADKKLQTINYWARKSKETKSFPIPDDLDCTVVTYAALQEIGIYSGEKTIKVMMDLEMTEGGPYSSWIVGRQKDRWLDLELGVNANVLWYALLNDIYLPNVLKYIYKETQKTNAKTPFYPVATVYYLISRAFRDGRLELIESDRGKQEKISKISKKISQYILRRGRKLLSKAESDIEIVLLSLTLLNLQNSDISKYVRNIIKRQKPNGSWENGSFNFGHDGITEKSSDGSAELTTAIALELLTKYQSKLNNPNDFVYPDFQKEYEKVERGFKRWLAKQQPNQKDFITKIASRVLQQVFTIRSSLLPFFFHASLTKTLQNKIDQKLLVELGVNNIIGWISYYLEDKIIDENIKDRKLLALATECKEVFLNFFKQKFSDQKDFLAWLEKSEQIYVDTIKWELSETRFKKKLPKKIPDYKNFGVLADRSIPFTYSIAALASQVGIKPASKKYQKLINFIRHHLIVKQLNDDATDVDEDFENGRINSVISIGLKKNRHSGKILTPQLIKQVSRLMVKHISLSEKNLREVGLKKHGVLLAINKGLIENVKKIEHELQILQAIS